MANAAIPLLASLVLFLAAVAGSLWVEVRPEYDAYALIAVQRLGPPSLVTFDQKILPEIKAGARDQPAYLVAVFSQGVLDPVITRLNLVSAWNSPSIDAARAALAGRITLKLVPGTESFRLTVRADTTERAVDLANALAEDWRRHVGQLDAEDLDRVLDMVSKLIEERPDDDDLKREYGLILHARAHWRPGIVVVEAADASTASPRLKLARREKAPLAAVALGAALLAAFVLLGVGVRRLFH